VIGLAIGAGAFGLARKARTNGPARTALLALAAGWTLLAGLAGVLLAGLWGLTDHAMAACNENLLQMNPLSLALLPLLPGALRGSSKAASARGLAVGVAVLSLAGLTIQLLPWFEQVNGPVIALAVPAHLGVAAALRRLR
jgi:hypothetical protein